MWNLFLISSIAWLLLGSVSFLHKVKSQDLVSCLDDTYCDSSRHQNCTGGFCQCSKNPNHIFIPSSQTCYIRSNFTCTISCDEEDSIDQKCVPNSECFSDSSSSQSICICDPGLVPNSKGICLKPFGSNCDRMNDICDSESNLECDETFHCSCVNSKESIYDANLKKCLLLVSSTCTDQIDDPNYIKCVSNSQCIQNECICDSSKGFVPNSERQCVLSFGETCSSTEPGGDLCNKEAFLECNTVTNKCSCINQPDAIFDPILQKCYLLIGKSCESKVGLISTIRDSILSCIPGSFCDPINDTCKCKGLTVSAIDNKKCVLKHGFDCNSQANRCDKDEFLECSFDLGTGREICLCANPESTWFDPSLGEWGKCVSLVGGNCSNPINNPCTSNTECKGNTCVCLEGLEPNRNGFCYLSYKAECTTSPTSSYLCDPEGFLYCDSTQDLCLCSREDEMAYEAAEKSCAIIPGSPCELHDDSTDLPICVKFAQCDPNSLSCSCKEGYEVSLNGDECVKSFGADCNITRCNPDNFLECVGGQCRCQVGYIPYLNGNIIECLPGKGDLCLTKPSPIGNYLCLPFLGCENGICDCLSGQDKDTIYIEETQSCYLKAEKNCLPIESNGQECVPNSDCLRNHRNSDVFQCICESGLVSNTLGFCVIPYGAGCNLKNDLCDPSQKLECNSKTFKCSCKNPDQSIYLGNECRSLIYATCGDGNHPCVENAFCEGIRNECRCKDGFIGDNGRQCALTFGSDCTPSSTGIDLCNKDMLLECEPDQLNCQCMRNIDTVFDFTLQKCFLLANSFCDHSDKNSTNALELHCAPGSDCDEREHICKCREPNTRSNKNRKCVLPWKASCSKIGSTKTNSVVGLCDMDGYQECKSSDSLLPSNSLQMQGQCGCINPYHSVYNPVQEECQLIQDSECSQAKGAQPCFDNSICQFKSLNEGFKCTCKDPSLLPNKYRLCYLPFEAENCTQSDYICDPDGGLKCDFIHNNCTCLEPEIMIWETETISCALRPSSDCSFSSPNGIKCVQNALCDFDTLTCQCGQGYENSNDLTFCMKSYGTECSDEDTRITCNEENFLECNLKDGNCQCLQDYFPYEYQTKGGHQNLLTNPTQCVPGYGSPCLFQPIQGTFDKFCLPGANLGCSSDSNRTCECENPLTQVYNEDSKRCVGLVGSPCRLEETDVACETLETCAQRKCAEFTHCQTLYPGSPDGLCICDEGYTNDPHSSTCIVDLGSKASLNFSPLSFLQLISLLFLSSI